MTARRFEVGELVDVAIRGARVVDVAGQGFAPLLALDVDGERLEVALSTSLTVTRRAPREWPPLAGDVWRVDSALWFARADEFNGVRLASVDLDAPTERPESVLHHFGRPELVYREGWSPETSPAGRDTDAAPEASAVATTGQSGDRRAETIAGLREATDWLERHPEVPLPYQPLLQYFVHHDGAEAIVELQDIGAVLGVAPVRSHPGGPHVKVIQAFRGGVAYEAVACDIAREDFEGPDVTPAVGEVAGPDSPQEGPATAADEPEHYHAGGAAGGPGDNEAQCACGTTYAGFDSQAEAVAALEQHIADAGKLPELIQPRPITDPALALASVPGAAVWTARVRRGLVYHKAGDLQTDCGRSQVSGELIPLREAVELAGTTCSQCYPAEG
jgi:hypothetical protein